jgi:hypothetical protein
MARTALTVQQISRSGLGPAYTAANVDGHSVDNRNQKLFLHVKNGSASSINVTVVTPATVEGLAVADLVVAVPNGGERMIGPFSNRPFNQTDGTIHVDFSAVTTVTVAAFKI